MRAKQSKDRWLDNRRQDGLKVARGIDGWIIFASKRASSWDRCPCCQRLFDEAVDARITADFLYANGIQ